MWTTTEPQRLRTLDVFGRVHDLDTGVGVACVGLAVHMPGGPMGRSTVATGETDAEGGYPMRVTFDGKGIFCEPGWLDMGVALLEGYVLPAEGADVEPLECTALPQRRDIALALSAQGEPPDTLPEVAPRWEIGVAGSMGGGVDSEGSVRLDTIRSSTRLLAIHLGIVVGLR